jgi:hypothetical protein
MRKFLVLAITFLSLNVSFGNINVIVPALKASEIFIPVGKTGQKISLMELSRINIRDFEILRGEKMKFFDRLSFKVAQKKLRSNIDNDGTFNNKKLVKAFTKDKEGKGGGASGFALGFLLNLIGVLIAYLIKDDNKKNRVKWAWIGFGAFIALALILLASGARLN